MGTGEDPDVSKVVEDGGCIGAYTEFRGILTMPP